MIDPTFSTMLIGYVATSLSVWTLACAGQAI